MNHDVPGYAIYAHLQLAAETLAQPCLDDGWAMVDHANTTPTGFSGSLFRHADTGQWVLSLSTNGFADKGAQRDKPTIHTLEFRERGWAFGQIADMELWFQSLKARGLLPWSAAYSVTGYGLGGHLVRAFRLLRERDGGAPCIAGTYTFNGMGMNHVIQGDLGRVIALFQQARTHGSASLFTQALTRAIYDELRRRINGQAQSDEVAEAVASLRGVMDNALAMPEQDLNLVVEIGLLLNAVLSVQAAMALVNERRVDACALSAERWALARTRLDATRLDYQLAAQTASGCAQAFALADHAVAAAETDHAYSFSEEWYEDRFATWPELAARHGGAAAAHPPPHLAGSATAGSTDPDGDGDGE